MQRTHGRGKHTRSGAWAIHSRRSVEGFDAVKLVQDLDQPFNQALVSAYLALLQQLCADEAVAREHAEQALALTSKYQAPYYRAWADILVSYALALEQPNEERIGRLRGSITAFKASGARLRLPYYLSLLAQVCGKAGRARGGARMHRRGAVRSTHTQRALVGRGDTSAARRVTAHARCGRL